MYKTYALMQGGRIYTLNPVPPNIFPKGSVCRFRGYCDGDPIGFFKTKLDFEHFVKQQPNTTPQGPHASATLRAETYSNYDGNVLLHKLTEALKKQKK